MKIKGVLHLFTTVCLRKMDLAFAVHNNLERGEFSTVKYYLKNVVDQFNIGEQNTHVAMMRYVR